MQVVNIQQHTYITVKLLVFSIQDSTHKIPTDYSQLYMTHDVIGKILQCTQERGNPEDLYAVSIMNSDV